MERDQKYAHVQHCRNCGVALEPHLAQCPLCAGMDLSDNPVTLPEYALASHGTSADVERRVFFRVVTLIVATAAAVVLVVDLSSGEGLRWSPIVLYSLVTGWVVIAVPSLGMLRWWQLLAGDLVAVAGVLYAVARRVEGVQSWFRDLAMPILAVVGVSMFVLVSALRRSRGLVRASVVLVAGGVLSLGIDLVILNYHGRELLPGWSAVVLMSVVPGALFLAVLQITVLRHIDLRRRFHL